MKVLMLDIDGVLINQRSFLELKQRGVRAGATRAAYKLWIGPSPSDAPFTSNFSIW